jgi:hypothetical protein
LEFRIIEASSAEEALEILKETFEKCPRLDGSPVCLMPPSASGALLGYRGYQIHINADLDEETKRHVVDILLKYQVDYEAINKHIMIFRRLKISPPLTRFP